MRSLRAVFAVACCIGAAAVTAEAVTLDELRDRIQKRVASYERAVRDITIVQDTRVSAAGEGSGKQAADTVTTVMRKGDKFRIESVVKNPPEPGSPDRMKNTVIHDGEDTWMVSPLFGTTKLSGQEARQYRSQTDWWNELTKDARITGTETVNGREAYVIETAPGSDNAYEKIWITTEGLNLARAKIRTDEEGRDVVMTFSDFRKIAPGAGDMPYRTEMTTDGETVYRSDVRSVKINQGLSDSLFTPGSEKSGGAPQRKAPFSLKDLKDNVLRNVE